MTRFKLIDAMTFGVGMYPLVQGVVSLEPYFIALIACIVLLDVFLRITSAIYWRDTSKSRGIVGFDLDPESKYESKISIIDGPITVTVFILTALMFSSLVSNKGFFASFAFIYIGVLAILIWKMRGVRALIPSSFGLLIGLVLGALFGMRF